MKVIFIWIKWFEFVRVGVCCMMPNFWFSERLIHIIINNKVMSNSNYLDDNERLLVEAFKLQNEEAYD